MKCSTLLRIVLCNFSLSNDKILLISVNRKSNSDHPLEKLTIRRLLMLHHAVINDETIYVGDLKAFIDSSRVDMALFMCEGRFHGVDLR